MLVVGRRRGKDEFPLARLSVSNPVAVVVAPRSPVLATTMALPVHKTAVIDTPVGIVQFSRRPVRDWRDSVSRAGVSLPAFKKKESGRGKQHKSIAKDVWCELM